MNNFNNDVALITGASRGIGKATALLLGSLGVKVFGTSTTTDGANEISKFLTENNIDGIGIKLDINDYESYRELIQYSKDVSILINNAGIVKDNIILRMTDDEWYDVIKTNLTSTFKLCKVFSKTMMSKKYGRIINVSSISAYRGEVGHSNYMAAKSGLIGLTRGMAMDLARFNITVNSVAPGLIDTDMTKNLKNRDEIVAKIPVGRIGTPEDVAHTISFLASRHSGFITGSTIHVNGGVYMN